MKTFNVAKSPKCQDEMRKILEAHETIYSLFLEFAKRSKSFDDNPAFTQSLQTALKLVRNKKTQWTYGMFLKSTYDVFYLVDVFKDLYTPEIQEKMDLVVNYLKSSLLIGGGGRQKLFEAVGDKENNPLTVYQKLDDIMWLQSLIQHNLKKIGASTNRDFLYKFHRYRKRQALKRLGKKKRRTETATLVTTEKDSESVDGEIAHSVCEDSKTAVKTKILARLLTDGVDDDEMGGTIAEECLDSPLAKKNIVKFVSPMTDGVSPSASSQVLSDTPADTALERKKHFGSLGRHLIDGPAFEESFHGDPLAVSQRSHKADKSIDVEDHKPDINELKRRVVSLQSQVAVAQADSRETDPLDITRPQQQPEPVTTEESAAKPASDIVGEPMASYIFSDSNLDIYSAKLADDRLKSSSLSSMQNALSKIDCSPRRKTRQYEIIDSMLSKLNSNVSLIDKLSRRNLSDQAVVRSNDEVKSSLDEQSRIDIILKLDPELIKVGPINVYHKNRSFVYRCKIEDCEKFYTLNLDLLQRHVLAEHVHHPFSDWKCSDCGFVRMIDLGIRGIMKHLSNSHSLEATSQIAVGRLKSLNESILKDIQAAGDCPAPERTASVQDTCHLFQCCVPNCSFSTDSSIHAMNHFNVKLDGTAEFTCRYCSTSVSTAYEYARHLIQLHGECQYKCGHCYYRGLTKATVFFHQAFCHPLLTGKMYRCLPHVPVRDASQESTRVNLVQLKCSHCSFNTTILDKFKKHISEEHPQMGFTCFLCQDFSTTSQKVGVIEHLLVHGIGEIQCLFCDRGFSNLTSVRKHFSEDHAEKYPFVMIRHSYFDKSQVYGQYGRIKEIPLGFESILGVDIGSDFHCENQLKVIDVSGSGDEDVAKQFENFFNPDNGRIILSDGPPKNSHLAPLIETELEPHVKQTARKKTSPSPLKLVPLSRLIDPKSSLPSSSAIKETARKTTRPAVSTGSVLSQKQVTSNFAPKPSTNRLLVVTKPKLGKVQSAFSTSLAKKKAVLNLNAPISRPPNQIVAQALPKTIVIPAESFERKSSTPFKPQSSVMKQTARKHTGGSPVTTSNSLVFANSPLFLPAVVNNPRSVSIPSRSNAITGTLRLGVTNNKINVSSVPLRPGVMSSAPGLPLVKNQIRVINISSKVPVSQGVSLIRTGTPSVVPKKIGNVSIIGVSSPSTTAQIPKINQESIVSFVPVKKKRSAVKPTDIVQ